MLTSVPTAINNASRQVTLRHPNAFDVVIYRKEVNRVELDGQGDPSEMGGAPTLGGMGVLRSEDEADFDYQPLGEGKMLFAAPFGVTDVVKHGDSLVAENQREVLVECKAKPDAPDFWVAETGDLLMVDLGMGVIMAYELVTISGTVNVPPYTRRYMANPRDDLAYLEPFADTTGP